MNEEEQKVDLKNRLLGIGAEVGGGVGFDFVTAGLLNPLTLAKTGGLSALAYGALNFGQGAYTNYLVQKHLYGNDEINWGEVIASGGMGAIPFMNIGASKGVSKVVGQAGTIKRGLVGGGLMGVAGEQARKGIDEGEFLSPIEAATAFGVGGAVGGTTQTIRRQIDIGKAKKAAQEGDVAIQAIKQVQDPNLIAQQAIEDVAGKKALKTKLTAQLQGIPQPQPIPQKSQNFAYSVYKRSNRGLLKQLKDQGVLQDAEDIVMKLDDFKQSQGASQGYKASWNPDRPTTGFKGPRTVKYTDKSGNPSEVGFRWSISKDTYVPYDLLKRNETILRRLRWNVNRSPKAKWYSDRVYSISKANNAILRRLLKELRAEDPVKYFEIMGDTRKYATNKGFIFVEHIHAQNSPFWKYMSPNFKPRDTKNLMIVTGEEFGKLKTNIESELYNNKNFKFPDGKRLIVDFDKTLDAIAIKQLQDNGRLKLMGHVPRTTNPEDWRKALKDALSGYKVQPGKAGEIASLMKSDPKVPPQVRLISDMDNPAEWGYDYDLLE
tara:strand:+ start:672 stop:2312 length:1641 start_codon:yes stop_codon:yes gene_type:complete